MYRISISNVLATVIAACMLAACGGGGGSDAGPAHVPSISQLSYYPASFPVSGIGTATATGQLYFTDDGGDIATVTISVTDSQGNELSSTSWPIAGAEGQLSGVIVGAIEVQTLAAGLYTVHITVSDARGSVSNELDGLVTVTQGGSQPAAASPTPSWTPLH